MIGGGGIPMARHGGLSPWIEANAVYCSVRGVIYRHCIPLQFCCIIGLLIHMHGLLYVEILALSNTNYVTSIFF